MARTLFGILGPLRLEVAGQPVPLPGVRQQKLLAFLLLNANAQVMNDRLVDVLWEDPPQSARQQIHNAVNSLRRMLDSLAVPDVTIRTVENGYQMRIPGELIDAHLFQSALAEAEEAERRGELAKALKLTRQAMAYWRGPALDGIAGQQISNVAARMNEQRTAGIERLMAMRLRSGEHASLVGELLELVAQFPYRETLRAHLMEALYRAGRQADALAVFDEGRRLLADNFGIDLGPLLQRLHLQILRSEAAPGPENVPGGERDDPELQDALSVPEFDSPRNFLPRDTAEFTGRSREVEQLSRHAGTSAGKALVISSLDGMGGVGKTALALHMAHELTQQYPDGQYFMDLHGFSAGREPLAPAHALDDLLRQTGVPVEAIPSDPERRSALWRSRMAGRRALLVLDNAVDVAQVRPLLPGAAEMLVIITSRRRLTALDGNLPLSLEVPPADEAMELFVQIAGEERVRADPDSARAVIELCGRLPLAVRIAAARFRDRGTWTLAYLVGQLRDQRTRGRLLAVGDRDVLAVLTLSYHHLAPQQQRVFRLLSLHPGDDFDAYAVAALADIRLEQAEQALDALYDDNLLLQHSADRYLFHDLVRDCSWQLLSAQENQEEQRRATHRLLDYYLSVAAFWCRSMAKGPFRFDPAVENPPAFIPSDAIRPDGSRPLQTEYHNILAAAEYAAKADWPVHAWQIPCAVQPLLAEMNYGQRALALFEAGLAAADRTDDDAGRSAALTGMASAHREAGANERAKALFEQAITVSRRAGNRRVEAFQAAAMGIVMLNDGDLEAARAVFTDGHRIAREIEDRPMRSLLANNLGVVTKDLGRYDEAMAWFRESLTQGAGSSSADIAILSSLNIGIVHQLQRRYPEAIDSFEDCLRRSDGIGFTVGSAVALLGLAVTRRALGDFSAALGNGRTALTHARRIAQYEIECDALNALGDIWVSAGQPGKAEALFLEAGRQAEEHNLPRNAARAHEGVAHARLVGGDLVAARASWEEALRIFPPGVADAENSRRHLTADPDGATRCERCVVRIAEVGQK